MILTMYVLTTVQSVSSLVLIEFTVYQLSSILKRDKKEDKSLDHIMFSTVLRR